MAKFITGTSGNPQGRPRQQTTQQLLRQAIQDALPDVVTVLINQARAGDQGACKILLDKGLASLKPQSDVVNFDIATNDTLADVGQCVIDRASRGEISPDIAVAFSIRIRASIRPPQLYSEMIVESFWLKYNKHCKIV